MKKTESDILIILLNLIITQLFILGTIEDLGINHDFECDMGFIINSIHNKIKNK